MSLKLKVLHLPHNVGGHPYGLSQAERSLGLDSKILTLYDNYINYKKDIGYSLNNKNYLSKLIKHIEIFLKYRTGYDIYHFNYGTTLLHSQKLQIPMIDLPFYSASSRKIFTFQGCDARQKFKTIAWAKKNSSVSACAESDCYAGICNSGKRDLWRQRSIEKAEKYADFFWTLNPDLLQFLPKEKSAFLPYVLANYHELLPDEKKSRKGPLRIVHAPTQRGAKGTRYILHALEKLKEVYGKEIEVVLVENKPHQEALQIYKTADLFIDQILVGWYGAAAVEVMKMGIPVCVYMNSEFFQNVPKGLVDDFPFYEANIFNLEDKLKFLLKNQELLKDLSQKSLNFVAKWHNPETIAKMVMKSYLPQQEI